MPKQDRKGRRGRKWGPLRGDLQEVRDLAAWLREQVDASGLTLRMLESHTDYSRNIMSTNLGGALRPSWRFVHGLLQACHQHGDLTMDRRTLYAAARSRWEKADPDRARRIVAPHDAPDSVLEGKLTELYMARVVQAVREEVERSMNRYREAEETHSKTEAVITGLQDISARNSQRITELTAERDRYQRQAHQYKEELERTRRQLEVVLTRKDRIHKQLLVAEATSAKALVIADAELAEVEERRRQLTALSLTAVLESVPTMPEVVAASHDFEAEVEAVLDFVDACLSEHTARLMELDEGSLPPDVSQDNALTSQDTIIKGSQAGQTTGADAPRVIIGEVIGKVVDTASHTPATDDEQPQRGQRPAKSRLRRLSMLGTGILVAVAVAGSVWQFGLRQAGTTDNPRTTPSGSSLSPTSSHTPSLTKPPEDLTADIGDTAVNTPEIMALPSCTSDGLSLSAKVKSAKAGNKYQYVTATIRTIYSRHACRINLGRSDVVATIWYKDGSRLWASDECVKTNTPRWVRLTADEPIIETFRWEGTDNGNCSSPSAVPFDAYSIKINARIGSGKLVDGANFDIPPAGNVDSSAGGSNGSSESSLPTFSFPPGFLTGGENGGNS